MKTTANRKLVLHLFGAVAIAFVASMVLTWLLHEKMTKREMQRIFDDIPEALQNTNEILDKIEIYSIDHDAILPDFPLPDGFDNEDDYLRYLADGQSDMQAFADRHGLKTEEVGALVFILTGIKGVRFRQLYQIRLVDELLRYTDMSPAEVARRSGLGGPNNLYLALRREYDMSATERRRAVRREGDAGRFRL